MPFETTFDGLLANCKRTAVHLETRDIYMPGDPDYRRWLAGDRFDPAQHYAEWITKIRTVVQRGVEVRRARIVSEPVSDYIRFEYDITGSLTISAGEQVRWLSRRNAIDLLIPAADFWIFDASVVMVNHFSGDGTWPDDGIEIYDDPALAEKLGAAFEVIWQRAVPHEKFQV